MTFDTERGDDLKQQTVESEFSIQPVSETAVKVEFGKEIAPEIHYKVKALMDHLDKAPFPGFIEYVASFASVTVFYDLCAIKKIQQLERFADKSQPAYQFVGELLREVTGSLPVYTEGAARVVKIPVCYGGQYGPDLEYVAECNQLTVQEVIDVHSRGRYLVYMLGFAPGFPYLGGMSERIAAPRRQSPRLSIPAGTVGIAGKQTGVYPIETPGGWQLIGRTPLELFCPQKNPPTLLRAGDIIEFQPISHQEYAAYGEDGK